MADFDKRFPVSITKFYRVIDRLITGSILISTLLFQLLHFIEYEEKKQDSWLYLDNMMAHRKMHNEPRWWNITQACNRVWSYCIQGDFLFSFNSKSPSAISVKWKPGQLLSVNTREHPLPLSLPLRISSWAWADMRAKIMHALPNVRDLRTSRKCCYHSCLFHRPRDQKKRRSGD